VAKTSIKELTTNIGFEAGNYIPHSIDAIDLDFRCFDPPASRCSKY